MSFVPLQVLYAAQLNALDASKADLDPVTGKVRASQLPDLGMIAHEELDAEIAAALAAAQAAQATATTADTEAKAAQASATSAGTAAAQADTHAGTAATAAAAAQAKADAAIPLSQRGAAGGVATLGQDGLVPASQLPPSSGSGGGNGPALTLPKAASFPTWVNKGSSSVEDTATGMLLRPELLGSSNGNVLKGVFQNVPVGDYDMEAIVAKCGLDWTYFECGIGLLDSGSGQFLTAMQGRIYFDNPASSGQSGDQNGVAFQVWRDAGYIIPGQARGIPCDTGVLHYRVTRVGATTTLRVRRGFGLPWLGVWGITPPTSFDQVGFCANVNCYGNYTNWPEQPFLVQHWGSVLP